MNVEIRLSRSVIGPGRKAVQHIPHLKAKGGPKLLTPAGMTQRACIQPLLSAEVRRIDDKAPRELTRMRGMPGDMLASRSVTPLTIDTISNTGAVEHRPPTLHLRGLRIGPMTFDTLSGDLLAKIDHGAGVPRTVAPAFERDIVRYRQLKKPVPVPVQIGLPLPARTDHDRKGLAFQHIPIEQRRLKKMTILLLQLHRHMIVVHVTVVPISKRSLDRRRARRPRVEIMRGLDMAGIDGGMAGSTSRRADKTCFTQSVWNAAGSRISTRLPSGCYQPNRGHKQQCDMIFLHNAKSRPGYAGRLFIDSEYKTILPARISFL